MALPDSVREQVETTLAESGLGSRIASSAPIGGGCVSNGLRLDTHDGERYFLKWKSDAPDGMFAAESAGLRALRRADGPRVPEPIGWSDSGTGPSWLLMEYVSPARAETDSDERMGRGLAKIHASAAVTTFGFEHDNWIGALPQANEPETSWATFWRDRRIVPQLNLARENGHLSGPELGQLVELIPVALEATGGAELLHGDLWSGNAYFSEGGVPVLIDPAVYRGDGEVDLAMSELFGGFGPRFYDAYHEVRPISPEYRSHRRDLYQLYYLLVHVNLFGASYVASTVRAARCVMAALR
ncbi:MAG: fructosamine kinase family protein [Gemmatimonadetes bacterium]|nr:fructosamine kinase family protein [Gemmatimonadota bacterium]